MEGSHSNKNTTLLLSLISLSSPVRGVHVLDSAAVILWLQLTSLSLSWQVSWIPGSDVGGEPKADVPCGAQWSATCYLPPIEENEVLRAKNIMTQWWFHYTLGKPDALFTWQSSQDVCLMGKAYETAPMKTIFSLTITKSSCIDNTVNGTKGISTKSCEVQCCLLSHQDFRILHKRFSWQQRADITGQPGSQETAPEYDVISCMRPWRRSMSFHCSCLTICHPRYVEWRTSSASSCSPGLPPSATLAVCDPQGALLQTWAQTHGTSLEWAERSSHCQHCVLGVCQLLSMPAC